MKVLKAGCILLDIDRKLVALVYREKNNDYTFPKGHLEEGESLVECAIRECSEETKRDCLLLKDDLIYKEEYVTPKGEEVIVYFYIGKDIGKSDNKSLDTHPVLWVPINEVRDKLTYDNLKVMWDSIYKDVLKYFNE